MNKIILALAICLLSTIYSNAQWYQRSCGVTVFNITTSEEFECLWNKSRNTVEVGAILSVVGTSLLVIGFVSLAHAHDLGDMGPGVLSVTIGLIMDFIGIPTLIAGIVRISQLKKTPYYEILNLGSLNLSPVVGLNQYNGSHYLGMSLSLNF